MLTISEAIERLDSKIQDSPDESLMYDHLIKLRSLASRIQLRLNRNDVRLTVAKKGVYAPTTETNEGANETSGIEPSRKETPKIVPEN